MPTDIALLIGEMKSTIKSEFAALAKSIDEIKGEFNRRHDQLEGRFDELEDRVDDLESRHDAVAGGAQGVGVVAGIVKDWLLPAGLATAGLLGYQHLAQSEPTKPAPVSAVAPRTGPVAHSGTTTVE